MHPVSDVAVASSLTSTTLSNRITVRSKRRIQASLSFRSFAAAERTIQGYEAMHMIRKGQVRWLAKGDIAEQVRFIKYMFGLSV
jgi:transposase-like protein